MVSDSGTVGVLADRTDGSVTASAAVPTGRIASLGLGNTSTFDAGPIEVQVAASSNEDAPST